MTGRSPVIVAARRTPIGRVGGCLRHLPVEVLAAPVLTAVLTDAGLRPDDVDDVILGNAAGPGGNPARVSALAANFPVSVPGVTIDRQCGSGLEAITLAARLIEAGAGDVFVAGGVESASTAPWRLERPANLHGAPRLYTRARFAPETIGDPEMGIAAENVADRYGISRDRQDRYALDSHRKAVSSQRDGRFREEIVPMPGFQGALVSEDECPRGHQPGSACRFATGVQSRRLGNGRQCVPHQRWCRGRRDGVMAPVRGNGKAGRLAVRRQRGCRCRSERSRHRPHRVDPPTV